MDEVTVEPQVEKEVVQEMVQESGEQAGEQAQAPAEVEAKEEKEETTVPLFALQKERKKRQELEQELQFERQRNQQYQKPPEEDLSKYESATREDLARTQNEAVRIVEERLWIKQNPERYEMVNDNLKEFLKQRPNLAAAISSAPNRWEEAYTLMDALTPKQQQQIKKASQPKKEAPGSPTSVPKAAAMNQTVDVMNMSDAEFSAWRKAQKRRS